MRSLILSVLPKNPADFDKLLGETIVYIAATAMAPPVGTRPLLVSSGVVDGASAQPGAVTPGKIMVIYGDRIGPSKLTGATLAGGALSTNLRRTQVLFDGAPAPLLYA